jgi:heme O synthase-like polyprenyltransferase
MATEPSIAPIAVERYPVRSSTALADYWALTKPEVNSLITVTTLAGFYLGYPIHSHHFPFALLAHTLLRRGERRGRFMAWQSVMPLLILALMIPTPVLLGQAGLLYLIGASVLSSGFLCFGAQLALRKSNLAARQLLFAPIIYLPLVFILLILDQR